MVERRSRQPEHACGQLLLRLQIRIPLAQVTVARFYYYDAEQCIFAGERHRYWRSAAQVRHTGIGAAQLYACAFGNHGAHAARKMIVWGFMNNDAHTGGREQYAEVADQRQKNFIRILQAGELLGYRAQVDAARRGCECGASKTG